MSKLIDFKKRIDEMQAAAPGGSTFIQFLFTKIGFAEELTYDIECLKKMEALINENWPEPKPDSVICVPFGYILGETIVRTISGAKWIYEAEHLTDVAIEIPMNRGEMRLMPFKRVRKFLNDRTDGIVTMYRTCELLNEVTLSKEYMESRMDKDGWVNFAWGDKLRAREASEEETKNLKNEFRRKDQQDPQ